ncbi:MAG: helix-turn-helix domain-containing protein [Planctomycetes bacterium]|nr:helix-turn-helix domain-containing protein [Planctomycetota bacterium]
MTEAENQTEPARLMTVEAVAAMLAVSSRHVYRLADSGKMPRPVKLGGSNRWDREVIENWIRESCPAVRHVRHAPRRGG